MMLDYGICPCGGSYEKRYVEVRMTVEGELILLENVPQGTCSYCGSHVYKTEVLERIESLMKGKQITIRLD